MTAENSSTQRTRVASIVTVHNPILRKRDTRGIAGIKYDHTNASPSLVWQIAVRDYKFGKGKHSSLTKATYDAVGNKFRALWGKEAGWAHSVLFTADLKSFSERLASKIEKNEEVDGIVKQEIKMENGDGIGGEEAKVVKKEIEKEIKTEDDTGEVEHKATKSRKRKVITTVKSEFVLESAIKMEHELDESVLEEGSMLDRVKRRRRVK